MLNFASSGIVATLLSSERAIYSRFSIQIYTNEDSTCLIYSNSTLEKLLDFQKLILDEAPMIKRIYIEAFNRTLRDIMRHDLPFDGKCVMVGGNLIQILLIIPNEIWLL